MSVSLDLISIVLVEPAVPGNIGSVARVMRNTGLSRLTLVRPGDWRTPECEWMAHGSADVLDEARVVEDLEEAVTDCQIVIGTTHRVGRFRVVDDDYRASLAEASGQAAAGRRIAVLFGREKDGLSRSELVRCQRLIRIPSAVPHPSFNLSHAVLLVAYELFRRLGDPPRRAPAAPLATAAQIDRVVEHLLEAMLTIGFRPRNEDPANFERVLRRFLGRAPLERRDAAVLHRLAGQVGKFARRLRQGPDEPSM
ncbi:MAG: RNA methyltransferase [Gemmatimonadaceae bacterium]|nr:RNA methyltransferase [Gemmatimonadaceae bacterium]